MTATTRPRPSGYVSTATAFAARSDLLWICDRWPDLKARLHPARDGGGDGVRTTPTSREPIDLHISDLMHEIETEARMLGRELLEEADDWQPTTSSMPGLLRDVAERYGHFTAGSGFFGQKRALDFCDWAHDYRNRVTHALERPASPSYIGDCPADGCVGDLYVKPGRTRIWCRECGGETDVEEQRKFVRQKLKERLMTPSELTSALVLIGLPVPHNTVKSWIQRKRLHEVVDGLYRLVDAMALAEARRSRAS